MIRFSQREEVLWGYDYADSEFEFPDKVGKTR